MKRLILSKRYCDRKVEGALPYGITATFPYSGIKQYSRRVREGVEALPYN